MVFVSTSQQIPSDLLSSVLKTSLEKATTLPTLQIIWK